MNASRSAVVLYNRCVGRSRKTRLIVLNVWDMWSIVDVDAFDVPFHPPTKSFAMAPLDTIAFILTSSLSWSISVEL